MNSAHILRRAFPRPHRWFIDDDGVMVIWEMDEAVFLRSWYVILGATAPAVGVLIAVAQHMTTTF